MTSNGVLIFVMAGLFLGLGYLGVPVAFALIAGVLVVTAFTPVGLPSIMTQLFNGMDVEALLAVPFFLLVGELMTAANVTALTGNLAGVTGGIVQLSQAIAYPTPPAPSPLPPTTSIGFTKNGGCPAGAGAYCSASLHGGDEDVSASV